MSAPVPWDPCLAPVDRPNIPGGRRIRVVEVLATGTNGGAQEHLYSLVTRMDATRYDVSVVALSAGSAVRKLQRAGVAVLVIDDPDDAIAQLERLEKQSGGFGCFLHMAHNWADWAETKRSYELFARYVMPRFQQTNRNREASMAWAAENRPTFIGAMGNAINQEIQRHVSEQQTKKKKTG